MASDVRTGDGRGGESRSEGVPSRGSSSGGGADVVSNTTTASPITSSAGQDSTFPAASCARERNAKSCPFCTISGDTGPKRWLVSGVPDCQSVHTPSGSSLYCTSYDAIPLAASVPRHDTVSGAVHHVVSGMTSIDEAG